MQPGADDYESIDVAARTLRERGWRLNFSPSLVLDGWQSLIESVEAGYPLTIDDYTNDLSIRDLAEEARPLVTDFVRRHLEEALVVLDERFLAATQPSAGRLPGASDTWWGRRLPNVLVGELAEDVHRMALLG